MRFSRALWINGTGRVYSYVKPDRGVLSRSVRDYSGDVQRLLPVMLECRSEEYLEDRFFFKVFADCPDEREQHP